MNQLMNCVWTEYAADDHGRRIVKCKRCGRSLRPTATPLEKIHATCKSWPLPHEVDHWLAIFSAAVGITQAKAAFDAWRNGGAKVEELPAKITTTNGGLNPTEIAELFPGDDPTLLGNRIAALTKAIGVPPCGACNVRREWLNKAHEWLRS